MGEIMYLVYNITVCETTSSRCHQKEREMLAKDI